MRKSLVVLLFGIATAATAQDQAKPAPAPQELDKDTQTRIRAERFAGGLGNITPEEKANANVGAGPHKTRKPKGSSKRAQDEPADAGATR